MAMNIQVNATIVVQIINFLIAYAILRFIVLRPAVVLIEAEEKKRIDLREVIAYNYLLIKRERDALRQQWQEGHAFYEKQVPDIKKEELILFKGIYPEHESPTLSAEMVDLLIENVSKELVEKVKAL